MVIGKEDVFVFEGYETKFGVLCMVFCSVRRKEHNIKRRGKCILKWSNSQCDLWISWIKGLWVNQRFGICMWGLEKKHEDSYESTSIMKKTKLYIYIYSKINVQNSRRMKIKYAENVP